jgi:hypothetical protein
MKILYYLLFSLLFINVYAQQGSSEAKPFDVKFRNGIMEVSAGEKIVEKFTFRNPSENYIDLDDDGIDELLIIDNYEEKGKELYSLYLFNLIDTFFLADSISSGITEPYIIYSEEIEDYVIVTGNPFFLEFTGGDAEFLPVNCYKYETGEVFQINDEIYDVFITENEPLFDFISRYSRTGKDCEASRNIISAIASAYANYINAGEPTLASHLVTEYYYCDDKDEFIAKLNEIIQK